MYCSECGEKLNTEDDKVCLECRKKLEEGKKRFILIGQRRCGNTLLSKIRYESEILICNEQIEVNTEAYWMKHKEYTFEKKDIKDILGKVKLMWSIGDVIRFLIFGLTLPVTNFQSIWGIFLSIKLMICNCIEICLKDGRRICIPVMQYADINPVMREIGGLQEKIKQFSERKIPEKKWLKRNTISTYIFVAITAVMIPYGIEQAENEKSVAISLLNTNIISEQTFDILKEKTTLEKTENDQGDVDKYIFDYNGKWSLEYLEEKVFVRFISKDVYDCLAGRFSEDAIIYANQFAYGFDDTAVNVYTDIDLGEEGNLSIITYDFHDQSYILMIDGEKYGISDSFRDYLNEYGLPEILQSTIEGFESDIKTMGLTRYELEELNLDKISQFVVEDKLNVKTVTLKEKMEEWAITQTEKSTEIQVETEQITEIQTETEQMAEPSDPDYYSAYVGILSDTKNQYGDAGDYCEYGLYDIDGDGIKELIIEAGTCSADWKNYVYKIFPDGVQCVGYFGRSVLLYEADDGNGIYAVWGMQGEEQVRRITLNGGEVKEEEILSRQINPDYESYITYPVEIQTAYMTDFSLLMQSQQTQEPNDLQSDNVSDHYSTTTYLNVTQEDLLRRPEQYDGQDVSLMAGRCSLGWEPEEYIFYTSEDIEVEYFESAYNMSGEAIGKILESDECYIQGYFTWYMDDSGIKKWYIEASKVVLVNR